MKRAEDARTEGKRVLSYRQSRDSRHGGREEKMVWLCWGKDEVEEEETVKECMIWLSARARCLQVDWMEDLRYNGKEWTPVEGPNRAFREDSEIENKSMVTMEHRSAASWRRLSISANLITVSVWQSDSHNSSSQNNFSPLWLGSARFASQCRLYDTQQYTIFEEKWKVLKIKLQAGAFLCYT